MPPTTSTMVRRFAVLFTILFWQGGFLFYGTVVVTVGSQVLGSDREQGFITRAVTPWLNVAGAVAVLAWAWELACEVGKREWGPWLLWFSLAITLVGLFVLHPMMDRILDPDANRILDRPTFRSMHRSYLRISTVQWLAAMTLLFRTIQNWSKPRPEPEREAFNKNLK